jgi:glutamine amidotransferase-like uncharacterized protein
MVFESRSWEGMDWQEEMSLWAVAAVEEEVVVVPGGCFPLLRVLSRRSFRAKLNIQQVNGSFLPFCAGGKMQGREGSS